MRLTLTDSCPGIEIYILILIDSCPGIEILLMLLTGPALVYTYGKLYHGSNSFGLQ